MIKSTILKGTTVYVRPEIVFPKYDPVTLCYWRSRWYKIRIDKSSHCFDCFEARSKHSPTKKGCANCFIRTAAFTSTSRGFALRHVEIIRLTWCSNDLLSVMTSSARPLLRRFPLARDSYTTVIWFTIVYWPFHGRAVGTFRFSFSGAINTAVSKFYWLLCVYDLYCTCL